MKALFKTIAVTVSFVMLCVAFVACSSNSTIEQEVLGDWTVSTIGGKTCQEYAAAVGREANMVAVNLKLETDKATLIGAYGSQEFQVAYKSDGIDLLVNGVVAGLVAYDKDAKTLTMKDNSTGVIIDYVFVKGTTELYVPGDEGNNAGFTGRDYGELTQEELDEMLNSDPTANTDHYTGRDYGELTQEELDEMLNDNSNTNTNTNTNTNRNTEPTVNIQQLTGRDYGELTQDELDDMGIPGTTVNTEHFTGADYGELTQDELDDMGIPGTTVNTDHFTGADYGENGGDL